MAGGWALAEQLGAQGLEDPLQVTGAAVLLYGLLYCAAHAASQRASAAYATLGRAEQVNWCSRVVSTGHALLACYGYTQSDVATVGDPAGPSCTTKGPCRAGSANVLPGPLSA